MLTTPDSAWEEVEEQNDFAEAPRTLTNGSNNPEEQNAEPTLGEWISAISTPAECKLDKVDPECRQDYIKKATWETNQERDRG